MNNHLNRNQCLQGPLRLWQSHATRVTRDRAAQRPNAQRVFLQSRYLALSIPAQLTNV